MLKKTLVALLLSLSACGPMELPLSQQEQALDWQIISCPAFTISNVTMSAPSPGALLAHPPIYYVKGGMLDVSLTIPSCTYVSGVRYGSVDLPTSSTPPDPIEPEPVAWYSILSDYDAGSGNHRVTLRMNFSNNGSGISMPVTITARGIGGTAVATYDFTMVPVWAVGGDATLSIAGATLKDQIVVGQYQKYGDWGSYTDLASGLTTYDPDYGDIDARVENDGVHLGLRFKAAVTPGGVCDPTIHVYGRFHLVVESSTVTASWDDGPHFSADFPFLCDLLLGPAPYLYASLYADEAKQAMVDSVQSEIDKMMAASGGNAAFVSSIETLTDEIRVHLSLPLEHVEIVVPYQTRSISTPFASGFALNPSDTALVIAGGLTSVCQEDDAGLPGTCVSLRPSAAGLFNWEGSVPVPNPWVFTGTGYVYRAERQEARNALQGFWRATSSLPMPARNPAALVARLANASSTYSMRLAGSPCRMNAGTNGQYRLAFGGNDYRSSAGYEFGTGSWHVTIMFLPVDAGTVACPL